MAFYRAEELPAQFGQVLGDDPDTLGSVFRNAVDYTKAKEEQGVGGGGYGDELCQPRKDTTVFRIATEVLGDRSADTCRGTAGSLLEGRNYFLEYGGGKMREIAGLHVFEFLNYGPF